VTRREAALAYGRSLESTDGVAVQDGTLSTATVLDELTLARRDSLLRRLGSASSEFKDRLRMAPLVTNEPTEQPSEGTSDLFAGLASGLRQDRRQEASHLSTELVLWAYYGKDNRRSTKRQRLHRDKPRLKDPRLGPHSDHRPQSLNSSLSDSPFQGPLSSVAREVGDHPVAHSPAGEGIAQGGLMLSPRVTRHSSMSKNQ